ncbi:MAG TPA: response regulator [Pararhizobium sp.]|uniref:response regulator transcription factor n=1 Tax=Pararhizobium sp. TaxID=1977563 RepID=UPI002B56409B|nr:response regulator [Pararhizobium sp.]HTO31545.1 response regulator [Pararhizobium sp.]
MDETELTVAIVDDDEAVRRALRRMVSSLSYRVADFPSGQAFLDELQKEQFACVLLDLHMPELNGIEVLARLRMAGHRLPAIIITGGDEPKMRDRCLSAGASDYLIKPLERDATSAAIQASSSLSGSVF